MYRLVRWKLRKFIKNRGKNLRRGLCKKMDLTLTKGQYFVLRIRRSGTEATVQSKIDISASLVYFKIAVRGPLYSIYKNLGRLRFKPLV